MVLTGLYYLLLALAGVLGLGFGALLSLGVSGSGELLLLRLAGGVGAGTVGVAALDRLLGTVPREAAAAGVASAAAAGSTAGAAIAFWGGARLIPAAGWQGAL